MYCSPEMFWRDNGEVACEDTMSASFALDSGVFHPTSLVKNGDQQMRGCTKSS